MKAPTWASFFAELLEDLSGLGRELYARHQGDVENARAELALLRHASKNLHAAVTAERDLKPEKES